MARQMTISSAVWNPDERSGLTPLYDSIEKLISVPLNPNDPDDGGYFDLYYFVHTPSGNTKFKSVLFCAGGPGEIVRVLDRAQTYADFLSKNGYNVVFFHLRGTGFSQIPATTTYDRFLKADYAVRDLEAIRYDFIDKAMGFKDAPWDAVIGWSFGTLLAQRYANYYPALVKRLILISPISRHQFKDSANAFDDYYDAMLGIYRQSLKEIYDSDGELFQNEFGDLRDDEKRKILDELFGSNEKENDGGILRKTEEAFGSIQFVIDAYSELKESVFERFGLKKFSRTFYQRLRDLRFYGSNTIDNTSGIGDNQRLIGKTLRDELLGTGSPSDGGVQLHNRHQQGNQRAYYSFGVQDGVNWAFLREFVSGKKAFQDAVDAIGGKAHALRSANRGLNKWLEKVKVGTEGMTKPWDPADFPHKRPTLILDGQADPVTAAGQAQRFFYSALRGPRTLIAFPGIGHDISLGGTESEQSGKFQAFPPLLSGAIRIDPPEIPPGEIREVEGIATGWELNAKLRVDLEAPPQLKKGLDILGSGILQGGKFEGEESEKKNVVALLRNNTDERIVIEDSSWIMRNTFFSGTVRIGYPKHIDPHRIQVVYGTLIHGEKNKELEIHVQPKQELEHGLTLVGFNVIPPAGLSLWIQNQSGEAVDEITKDWVIYNQNFKIAFKVNVPRLEPNEIKSVEVGIDGLNIDVNEVLQIEIPANLDGDIAASLGPQEQNSKQLSIILWNREKTKMIHVDQGGWELKCLAFSAALDLEPVAVEPGTVKQAKAAITGINWANCLNLTPPKDLERELELIAFNVLQRDKVSMLIKNKHGHRTTKGAARDWIYVDPHGDSNLTDLNQALNCLIFSFLVLDPKQFHSSGDNEILKQIQAKFEKASLEINLKHADEERDPKN